MIKRPPNANGQRRTKMCTAIQEGRACRFGQACKFAHSTAELERMAPADPNARHKDGSLKWQPHLRKTKLCRFFMERGECPYGARCYFAHGEDQLESARQPSRDFLQRQGLDLSSLSRGGFESRIDRSRSDEDDRYKFTKGAAVIVENLKIVNKGVLSIVDPRKDESRGLFMCPITQDVLVNPVVASDGYTYSICHHEAPRSECLLVSYRPLAAGTTWGWAQ